MSQGIKTSEKIRLLETALHSNYTRRPIENISVYQLVNRLMLLYQTPLLFMFYKKEDGKDSFEFIFHTYKDIFFTDKFNTEIFLPYHYKKTKKGQKKYFYKVRNSKRKKEPNASLLPEKPYLIGDTGYGYIIISLWRDEQDHSKLYFRPFSDYKYKSICNLWYNFLERKFSKSLGVEDRIKKSFEIFGANRFWHENTINNARVSNGELYRDFNPDEHHLLESQMTCLNGIFNDIYVRLSSSPLLSNNDKIPPDIIFFIRYYDEGCYIGRSTQEHSDNRYEYSICPIIPKKQEQHIRLILGAMKVAERQPNTKTWRYSPLNRHNEKLPVEERAEYVDADLADKFWEYLQKDNAEDDIMEIVRLPYGKGATGMVDSPLCQGFLEFKRRIFWQGGAERLSPNELKRGFDSLEVKRSVIFHYLLSAIAPACDTETLGALVVPLRVSSSSYCALLFTTDIQDKQIQALNGEAWLRNYHFFNDVARQTVRTLRRKARKAYCAQLNKILYQEFELICKTITDPGFIFNEHQAVAEVNKKFKFLCRIWPYRLVELILVSESEIEALDKNRIPFLNGRLPISFAIKDNPFFIREGNYVCEYLTEDKVKDDFEKTFNKLENFVHFVYISSRKDSGQ